MKTARTNPTLQAALAYVRAGLSVLPVMHGGRKRPDYTLLPRRWNDRDARYEPEWETFQSRLPTEEEVRDWFGRDNPPGVAIIGGAVSGSLECIDFDRRSAELYPLWCDLVEAERPG